jgi:hypothetical protein
MATIDDRVPFVAVELGNRADLSAGTPSRIENWLWQSYLNLGMSYKFHESEFTLDAQWQQGADSIDYPQDCRAILNVAFFRAQDGTAIKIQWKNIAYLRRYPTQGVTGSQQVGPPAIIASFNEQVFVRPLCDQQVYNVVIDFWQKPVQDQSGVGATELLVPDDFLEIVDMGAMMRGHASLGEVDRAQQLQQLLYGYTLPTSGKFVPGMIAQMYTRRQAEAPGMDYNIQPTSTKRSYTNVGG